MTEAGILDPTKVTRSALQNASSVAAMVLTTESLVTDKPDPQADAAEAKALYGIEFVDMDTIKGMNAVILAVAHQQFSGFTMERMDQFFGEGRKVLLDIKGLLDRKEYEAAGYSYWRL